MLLSSSPEPSQTVSIGAWEEPDMGANQSILPTSPTGVVGVATGSSGAAGQQESPELTLEYWSPKGQSQKVQRKIIGQLLFPVMSLFLFFSV